MGGIVNELNCQFEHQRRPMAFVLFRLNWNRRRAVQETSSFASRHYLWLGMNAILNFQSKLKLRVLIIQGRKDSNVLSRSESCHLFYDTVPES